jgi:hypothetical protein
MALLQEAKQEAYEAGAQTLIRVSLSMMMLDQIFSPGKER